MKNKNIIFYSISVVFLTIFIGLFGFGILSQNKKSLELSQKVSEIKVIEEEIAHNQRLIESLEKEYKGKLNEKATSQTLFLSANEKVYKDFFPAMKAKEIKGITAFSLESFPDKAGCITKAQLNEMIKAGWEYAILWDGKGNLDSYLNQMRTEFSKAKIEMPQTFYFYPKTYSKKYNKTLEKYNFNTVIHHGEEDLSLISGKFTKPIWFIGAAPILSTRQSVNVAKVIRERGNMVYTVEIENMNNKAESEFIKSLIVGSKNAENQESFLATNIKEARDIHGNLSNSDLKLSADFRKKRKVYEDKIKELDDKIDKIYYGNIND